MLNKISLKSVLSLSIYGLLITFSHPIFAESPLWKVSKGDQHLYIGGTIHILSPSDYPLPAEFDNIYKQSQLLVLETDFRKFETQEFQSKLMQEMVYKDGSTIVDKLTSETLEALEAKLKSNGIPMQAVQQFKPGMLLSILTVVELKKLGVVSEGVDKFYNDKSVADNKSLGKLETIDQQIKFLSEMGLNNPDDFIKYTLRDLKRLPEIFPKMKEIWRKGDMSAMDSLAVIPLKTEFPSVYEEILVKRNNAWIPQIESMLKTKEIEMILVGALHLAGEESVLKKLESKGYKVEQY